MITFLINGEKVSVDLDPQTPLLWALRDTLGLRATKYGCGIGQCGACTVHLDGKAVRSCQLPVNVIQGKNITTLEGLANGEKLHPVQQAWMEADVPQCGYCQSGQLMRAAALLEENADPSEEEIRTAMQGNLCRCGIYTRILKAIQIAAKKS